MIGYLIAPLAIGATGCGIGTVIGPLGVDYMLDFYEGIVGLPITDREVPWPIYSNIMIPTIAVVFSGIPALKASNPLEVLSGQIKFEWDRTLYSFFLGCQPLDYLSGQASTNRSFDDDLPPFLDL